MKEGFPPPDAYHLQDTQRFLAENKDQLERISEMVAKEGARLHGLMKKLEETGAEQQRERERVHAGLTKLEGDLDDVSPFIEIADAHVQIETLQKAIDRLLDDIESIRLGLQALAEVEKETEERAAKLRDADERWGRISGAFARKFPRLQA